MRFLICAALVYLCIASAQAVEPTVQVRYSGKLWTVPVRDGYLPEIEFWWDGTAWRPVYIWTNKYPAAPPYVINNCMVSKQNNTIPAVTESREPAQTKVEPKPKTGSIDEAIPDKRTKR